MVWPREKPILKIDTPHSSIQHALCIVGSGTALIPKPKTALICGSSSVMVVDNWLGIVRAIPPRGRNSRNQIHFVAAEECSGSKPGIEATDRADSGPPIGDVGTYNDARSDKAPRREKKGL